MEVLTTSDKSVKKQNKESIKIEFDFEEEAITAGELAVGIAHEIRNLLSVISMATHYLDSRLSQNNELKEYVKVIVDKVDKLNKISQELISYAKHTELNLETKDVHNAIDSILNLIEPRCKMQTVEVIKNYDEKLPDLTVDYTLIDSVFTNLINNALEAMPKGGKLIIHTEYNKEEKIAVIKIANTGDGMNEQQLSNLFKPFFTTKKHGTGLGLAIVKNIIDMHSGTIKCENNSSNDGDRGTVFTIKLWGYALDTT